MAGAVKLNHTSALLLASEVIEVYVADMVVPLADDPFTVMEVGLEERSLLGGGVGMLKVEDVVPVRPAELKVIVAPVTAAALVAVNPEKVATPEDALIVVVPPRVQVPEPTAAATAAELPVTVLPY